MVAWHEVTAMVRYAALFDTALNTVTCHRHMCTAKSSLKWPLLKQSNQSRALLLRMVAAQWRAPLPFSNWLKPSAVHACFYTMKNMILLVEHVVNETPRPPSCETCRLRCDAQCASNSPTACDTRSSLLLNRLSAPSRLDQSLISIFPHASTHVALQALFRVFLRTCASLPPMCVNLPKFA